MVEKIGKYQVTEKIGVGGFGQVYKGRDPYIKRIVAIKTCQSEDEEIKKRFFKEAEFAGNLHHRNIVTIYDFGVEDGIPYIVQEYLTGEDLDKKIKRRESLPVDRKIQVLIQICDALEYAHQAGIIHRDIKPANIRIMDDGSAKMMDFGIAKSLNMESTLTQTGITLGTAAYLAPEQIKGEPVDQRTDIFSLGVMMYELFAYDRPFKGDHISTVLYRILHEEAPDLRTVDPSLPPRLSEVVAKAMAKDPATRYSTVAEVRNDLGQVFVSMGGTLESSTQFVSTMPPATTSSVIEVLQPADEEKTRTTPSGIPVQPAPKPPTSVAEATIRTEARPTPPPPAPAPSTVSRKGAATGRPAESSPDEEERSKFSPVAAIVIVSLAGAAGWFGWKQLGLGSGPGTPPIVPPPAATATSLPEPVPPSTPAPSDGVSAAATGATPAETPRPGPAQKTEPKGGSASTTTAPVAPKAPVSISISTNFAADVFLDGEPLGPAALSFQAEALPGKREIRLSIDGYMDHTMTVDVKAGGANRFQYRFPEWGKLTVTNRPGTPGGQVFIDGKPRGATPLVDVKLQAGPHVIEVVKDGFAPWRSTVEVEPRKKSQATVELQRSGG